MNTIKILTAIIFAITLVTNSYSQWNSNPALNSLLCNAPGNQRTPVVVNDQSGGVIAAWIDERNPSFTKIYVQKFSSEGVPQWQANGVELSTTQMNALNLMIISDGTGGAIICWKEQRVGISMMHYVRKISHLGVPQWPSETAVSDNYTASEEDDFGCITTDHSGGVIICYRRYNNSISKFEIHAQQITANGLRGWGTNGVVVASTPVVSYENPQICTDDAGGMIVAFGKYSRTLAQRLNSNGAKQWGSEGFDIYGSTVGSMINAVICRDGVGGAIITCLDGRTPANEFDIYAQRVKNGIVQWGNTGKPIAVLTSRQWRQKIIYDENYGVYIAWEDDRQGSGTDSRPYIQRVDIGGNIYFPVNGIKATTQACGMSGLTIGDSSAVYMLSAYSPSAQILNLHAQKITNTGALPWGNTQVLVSSASSMKGYDINSFTADNSGVVWLWDDYRNNQNNKIYGHKIQSSGLTSISLTNEIPSKFELGQNYPNPFNPATNISFSIPKQGLVKLAVYDISGKEVAVLVNENKPAGKYEITFNASGLSSGAYFYRISAGDFTETKKMLMVK